LLKFSIPIGHATLHGVEYQPISNIHTLAAGAKVVIERAVIRGGYLLLDQHSFTAVLFRGHHVDALVRTHVALIYSSEVTARR
jgi:hypothetical protein